jgi:hypothetical protein
MERQQGRFVLFVWFLWLAFDGDGMGQMEAQFECDWCDWCDSYDSYYCERAWTSVAVWFLVVSLFVVVVLSQRLYYSVIKKDGEHDVLLVGFPAQHQPTRCA